MTTQAYLVQFLHTPLSAPSPSHGPNPFMQDTSPHGMGSLWRLSTITPPSRLIPPKGTSDKIGKISVTKKLPWAPQLPWPREPVEPQIISHKVFLKTVKFTGKFSTDQTGCFLVIYRAETIYGDPEAYVAGTLEKGRKILAQKADNLAYKSDIGNN